MTSVLYFRNCKLMCCAAKVRKVSYQDGDSEGSLATILLDKTVFYPQGGGQPSDRGTIYNDEFKFEVTKVTHSASAPGEVDHAGTIQEGRIAEDQDVFMEVDGALRTLHNRLHTAGHIIDAAIQNLGITTLVAGKAYHFNDGPYVEYSGEWGDLAKEEFLSRLQTECLRLIELDLPVYIDFANDDVTDTTCERKMRIADLISIPCGGTHVDRLSQVGGMVIRKIENKKGKVKVAYQIRDALS